MPENEKTCTINAMFEFEQQWIVYRSTKKGSTRFGFSRIESNTQWHTLDNKPVEVVPSSEWSPMMWASLAYAALCTDGAHEVAYLPYQLLDTFQQFYRGKDFGDKMPMFIFLIRSIVACHREVDPGLAISRQEAQKVMDNYNAV